jgi:hypothetical protein
MMTSCAMANEISSNSTIVPMNCFIMVFIFSICNLRKKSYLASINVQGAGHDLSVLGILIVSIMSFLNPEGEALIFDDHMA